MEWLQRLDKLADRHCAGSAIVNDGKGRFFERGSPRSHPIGLRLIGAL
jgi:hypothetical protein